jgi:IclR family transcriptional regulator, mhp operon transcriptional activator
VRPPLGQRRADLASKGVRAQNRAESVHGAIIMQPKPIRSFARGLAVLEALNKYGSATALMLARESGVPRATVYRLLQTLLDAGYVDRGFADERFRLRLAVRRLSGGFKDAQWISAIATPRLIELTQRISWPCDVATLDGLAMVVRDTTHPIAPLSIDYNMAGQHMPLLGSSTGLAYLTFAPTAERALLLDMLERSTQPCDALAGEPRQVERVLAATRRRGYGLRQSGALWPHTSSIALPIRQDKRVLGCISVIWMARVMGVKDAVRLFLEPMRETQTLIEQRLHAES